MIALHYISDRDDSEMWVAQKSAQIPDSLQELLDLWKERTPHDFDIPKFNGGNYELFSSPHFWHVGQGQGVLNRDVATMEIEAYASRAEINKSLQELASHRIRMKLIPHASIFKEA